MSALCPVKFGGLSLALLVLASACGATASSESGADASTNEPSVDAAPQPTVDAAVQSDAGELPADNMVLVEAGAFDMGCADCDADEAPVHSVNLSAFEIDVTEVTQAAYAACVNDGACTNPSSNFTPNEAPNHPVTNVTWQQSVDFCTWAGKRLPTEAEWEKASRGTDGRVYPWGDDDTPNCQRANTSPCGGAKFPVGALPAGVSPYGAMDMAGNVWEWTADFYAADAYANHEASNPQGPASGETHTVRGGSSGNLLILARGSNRSSAYNASFGGSGVGFRCARDLVD